MKQHLDKFPSNVKDINGVELKPYQKVTILNPTLGKYMAAFITWHVNREEWVINQGATFEVPFFVQHQRIISNNKDKSSYVGRITDEVVKVLELVVKNDGENGGENG